MEAPAIGAVFQLTNHSHSNWTHNNEIVSIPENVSRNIRSTSVGDIVGTVGPGKDNFFAIAPTGLKRLPDLDENFTVKVPKLYGEAV